MRVEDVGSLSPAGDLLAFSLAIILTFGLISTLSSSIHKEEGPFPFEQILRSVMDWEFLDPDNDGLLELPSNTTFKESSRFIRSDISFLVRIRTEGSDLSFSVIEGSPQTINEGFRVVSVTHSASVLIELDGVVQAGSLSICELGEST